MTWQCSTCSETHADQFDACWNCAGAVRGDEAAGTSLRDDVPTPAQLSTALRWVKLAGCVLAGVPFLLVASPEAVGTTWFNLLGALFAFSIICWLPQVHWVAPLTIVGCCIGIWFPGSAVNGGIEQLIKNVFWCGLFGFVLGCTMEFGFLRMYNRHGTG